MTIETGYKILRIKGNSSDLDPYKSLIFSTWLRGLRHGNDWFEMIDQEAYFDTYHKVISAILSRPSCTANIAVLADDTDTCLGYSIYDGSTLHFIFVKKDLRKQGIGKALATSVIENVSHLTKIGTSIWKRKYKQVKFNPFI